MTSQTLKGVDLVDSTNMTVIAEQDLHESSSALTLSPNQWLPILSSIDFFPPSMGIGAIGADCGFA